MRVLQVGETLAARFGGTAAACAQLSNHLAIAGIDVSVLTLGGVNGGGEWRLDPRIVAKTCTPWGPARLGYSAEVGGTLESLTPTDVLHVHGLWRLHYLQSARFAFRRGIPLIVSVHGMLHARALRQRAGLKRAARWIFQDALLGRARCLHATAVEEAEEIRRAGFTGPIAVLPWGVEVPSDASAPAVRRNAAGRRPVALYLGRLHPSKGLEPLLRAWAQVSRRFPDWKLVVAGYDEDSYGSTLSALASALGVTGAVTFAGAADGAARERLFADASLVVLPSPAENFGLVVPEALARGVPVVATKGAPWSMLASEGCGWWVAPDEASLAGALASALVLPADALREMGERGRALVRAKFTWGRTAASMVELYEWLLGRRAEPTFVANQ